MANLNHLRDWLESHRDLALDGVRIYLGFALFAKGIAFLRQGNYLVETLRSTQIGVTEAGIAHYVVAAHLFGGLLLAIGLVTRFAAALQLPVLAGAVLFVHAKEGLFTNAMRLELSLLVLFLLVLFSLFGSGRYSADFYVFRPRQTSG